MCHSFLTGASTSVFVWSFMTGASTWVFVMVFCCIMLKFLVFICYASFALCTVSWCILPLFSHSISMFLVLCFNCHLNCFLLCLSLLHFLFALLSYFNCFHLYLSLKETGLLSSFLCFLELFPLSDISWHIPTLLPVL